MAHKQGTVFRPPSEVMVGIAMAISLSLVANMACSLDIRSVLFIVAFLLSGLASIAFAIQALETEQVSKELSAALGKALEGGSSEKPEAAVPTTSNEYREAPGGRMWDLEQEYWAYKARYRKLLWISGWLLATASLIVLCISRATADDLSRPDVVPTVTVPFDPSPTVFQEELSIPATSAVDANVTREMIPASDKTEVVPTPQNHSCGTEAVLDVTSKPGEKR